MRKKHKPSKFAYWIIRNVTLPEDKGALLGDIEEDFYYNAEERGIRYARKKCREQVMRSCFSFLNHYYLWRILMVKNYVKIAFRNILKYKVYSFINLSGLAVGMACCLLMLLWVKDELSYDSFYENADEIYRVIFTKRSVQGSSQDFIGPPAVGPSLKAEYPDIINSTRILSSVSTGWHFKYGNKGFFHFSNPKL